MLLAFEDSDDVRSFKRVFLGWGVSRGLVDNLGSFLDVCHNDNYGSSLSFTICVGSDAILVFLDDNSRS